MILLLTNNKLHLYLDKVILLKKKNLMKKLLIKLKMN